MDSSTNKEIRYDRQLRLWGDHGQRALENANIAMIHVNGTGTEILKSLILPGVGSFTIFDSGVVSQDDVGRNFFLTEETLNMPRGQAAVELLQELNPSSKGSYINESAEQLLQNNICMLAQFSVVIACDLTEKTQLAIGAFLWKLDVPFIICRSYGYMGYVRLIHGEHIVMESHPDNPLPDFRLQTPFAGIKALVEATDLNQMNHKDHSHVPYLVLLHKFIDQWQRETLPESSNPSGEPGEANGITKPVARQFPGSYKEKKEFKAYLLKHQMPDEKGRKDEENFEEAANAVNRALTKYDIPAAVRAILDHRNCVEIERPFEISTSPVPPSKQKESSSPSITRQDTLKVKHPQFWLVMRGVKKFLETEGGGHLLPLEGSIPDMISSSGAYIKLANIYRDKATADAQVVHSHVLDEIASSPSYKHLPVDFVSFDYVKRICRHVRSLSVIQGKSLSEEHDPEAVNVNIIKQQLEAEDSQMYLYVLLRAAERFFMEMNRYPGTNGIPVDLDKNDLKTRVMRFLSSVNLADDILPESFGPYLEEFCRYGAAELHTTAAYMGGVSAQEVIKLITGQYVPIDNTYVFNGITGESAVFKL